MKVNLYVDMDGTLYRFHDDILDEEGQVQIEKMYEVDFFLKLKPFENLVDTINRLHENNNVEIYFLSAVSDEYIEEDKKAVLRRDFPWVDVDHMLFPYCGCNKAEFVELFQERELENTDILLDDYNQNLEQWLDHNGTSIKFVNNINHKGIGLYGGDKGNIWEKELVRYDDLNLYESISKTIRELSKEKER